MDRIDIALLLLRLVFGVSIALHGLNKFRSGITGTAAWFASIGFRWARRQAITAATTEIVAGILLVLGLLDGPAVAALIALMVVAIATVHWKVGFFIFLPNGGWEYCASIAAVGAALALTGPGRVAVDETIGSGWTSGPWWIVVGVAAALCHLSVCWRPSSTKPSA